MSKKLTIKATHYENNECVGVQLSNGRKITIEEAISLASQGELDGFTTGATRGDYSHATLKGVADGNLDNNLSNLPRY